MLEMLRGAALVIAALVMSPLSGDSQVKRTVC
jgi:hypothetical protein